MRTFVKEQFLPDGVMRVGLTAEGIKFLAIHAPEIIPNLPPLSEIKDKSKASSASKVIACMQVFLVLISMFRKVSLQIASHFIRGCYNGSLRLCPNYTLSLVGETIYC
jgi:hypothetical protein